MTAGQDRLHKSVSIPQRQGLTAETVITRRPRLSGGYGSLIASHGLASDGPVGAELVLADGRHVTANADNNPDFLWAPLGGWRQFRRRDVDEASPAPASSGGRWHDPVYMVRCQ